MAETEVFERRREIEADLAEGRWLRAKSGLDDLWRAQPTAASAGYIISRAERLRPHLKLTPCRLMILRSFTVEPIVPILKAAGFAGGIDFEVSVGAFNAYAQEILDVDGALYRTKPDVVLIAVQTRDALPELWEEYTDLRAEDRQNAAKRVIRDYESWLSVVRSNCDATVLIHNFEQPCEASAGLLDSQNPESQSSTIRQINLELCRLARNQKAVHVVDYEALVARHGRQRWHDEKKWLTMRMPIRSEFHLDVAAAWLRLLHPVTGRVGKVLVTDLDNTLWGGVLSEDGRTGIKLGREYPGAAYYALQRALLDVRNRGILLAIASKNNQNEAVEALNHSEMLLKPEHFAAMRINWAPKSANLREIAGELNVGTDSLVFLDDNPAERQEVRMALPEVTVIELPSDPMQYAAAVRSTPFLERLQVSDEDVQRSSYYRQERRRRDLEQSASSLEEYYQSLQQEVELLRADEETITRIAQLTQKTNQFNVTTRRYTDAQISRLAATDGWNVYSARVRDRFGDAGIVGVVITHRQGSVSEIDSFLLSCRVIGRTVETAMLSFIAAENRRYGVDSLEGWFYPTPKNAPAAEFYRKHGFSIAAERDGGSLWSLSLRDSDVTCPPWIILRSPRELLAREAVHS